MAGRVDRRRPGARGPGRLRRALRTTRFAAQVAARTCEQAGAEPPYALRLDDEWCMAARGSTDPAGRRTDARHAQRAGTVLDLFTTEDPEWGVTATAQRLGIGKSLAHDILSSLAAIGLLQRVGHGRYRLGWRTISLASVLLRTSDLKAQARPVVRELADRQRLPVSLAAWDCDRIIYLGLQTRPAARRLRAPCGDRGTARRSAIAKVLLAGRPAQRGRDAVERRARAQRAHVARRAGVRPRARAAARLGARRRRGVGAQLCVAAPVRDPEGTWRPRSASTSPTSCRGSTPTRTRARWWRRRRRSRPRCATEPGRMAVACVYF